MGAKLRKYVVYNQLTSRVFMEGIINTEPYSQRKEVDYLDSYLLPLSQKADIQKALDQYGAVRLEKGDYSGVNVVMHSNQSLYGHASTSGVANITIASGSTNVHLESLRPLQNSELNINFQAGAEISNCSIKSVRYCIITGTSASLSSNVFIDIQQSQIQFDCSSSGYIRNNKIIKHMKQGGGDVLVFKGNRQTPSYGNVSVHTNFLSNSNKPSTIDNLESYTFIAVDTEIYDQLTGSVVAVNNVDRFKLNMSMGGIYFDPDDSFANIDAGESFIISSNGEGATTNKITPRTNILSFNSSLDYTRNSGTVTGYFAKQYITEVDRNYTNHFTLDGVEKNSLITNSTTTAKLSNSILGTKYTPWVRPTFEPLPNLLGSNWRENRLGKPDSTAYIQNLIDTNKIAELPEGVFYISSTLIITPDKEHGIIGQGTGKTIICGLTDDFPLITVNESITGAINLAYLTLQGGSTGLYISSHEMFMIYQSLKYIVFREQISGIELYDIYGLDNCFFENLAFVNCTTGIYAHPKIQAWDPNNLAGSTYMDKTMFYKCQFLNCATPLDLSASRACNMNAWVDCKIDGATNPCYIAGDNKFMINSDFTNCTGDYLIKSNEFSFVNCDFYNNTNSVSTLNASLLIIEGCNFLDTSDLFSLVPNNKVTTSIYNSLITGNAILPNTQLPLFSNSKLLSNPTFSKLLVKGVDSTPTVLIGTTSNPYPQFLVTQ